MKKSLLLGILFTGLAEAGGMGAEIPDWRWVGSLSAGPIWGLTSDSSQTFYLTPDIVKTYLTSSRNTIADAALFFGVQRHFDAKVQTQLGLDAGATSDAEISGSIWDDADPLFNNYIYQYKVQHTWLDVKGKLFVDMGYSLIPWVSAGLGLAFNTSHAFHNTPVIFEAVETPDFSSHTTTAFTYTLGLGLQKTVNDHWQIGMGYEFSDWGKHHLGRAAGQTLNTGLGAGHIYTNGIIFNLTYLV